jgi:hypothetical protein
MIRNRPRRGCKAKGKKEGRKVRGGGIVLLGVLAPLL